MCKLSAGRGSRVCTGFKVLEFRGFLEKSLKSKPALKSTGKSLKSLEKSMNSTISVGLNTVDRDLNQYKIVVHNDFMLVL